MDTKEYMSQLPSDVVYNIMFRALQVMKGYNSRPLTEAIFLAMDVDPDPNSGEFEFPPIEETKRKFSFNGKGA